MTATGWKTTRTPSLRKTSQRFSRRHEDGEGNAGATQLVQRDLPAGYSVNSTDCDDGDAAINPRNTQWYTDVDRDGYGTVTVQATQCNAPGAAYASVTGDCNDGDASVKPGATEVCDSVDNDCNGAIDDADGIGLDTTTAASLGMLTVMAMVLALIRRGCAARVSSRLAASPTILTAMTQARTISQGRPGTMTMTWMGMAIRLIQ